MNRFLETATGVETHAWLAQIRMQDAEHAARVHRSIRGTRRTSDRSPRVPWRSIVERWRAPAAIS